MCSRRGTSVVWVALLLIIVQAGFLGYSSYVHSPTHLEVFHLPAGMSHLETSRYDLYRVNPPLVRTVAALPAYMSSAPCALSSYNHNPHARPEYAVGIDTMYANGSQFIWLVTLGRWACVPLVLLGGWICFCWACELYGNTGGIIAFLFWVFCPYVLGHGSLITPDVAAASLGVCATYFFWRWLKSPSWKRAMWLGILLGIAELSKFTLLIFYPIWPLLWIIHRVSQNSRRSPRLLLQESGMLMACFSLSFVVINVGYEFEGSLQRLGDYRFQSTALTGVESHVDIPESGGNRLDGTWLAEVLVPLPSNFLYGLDMQKKDFETGIYSYLRGTWQNGGWWYFHLYALAVKMPLGIWGIIFMSAMLTVFVQRYNASWRDEMLLLAPVILLLFILCWNSGIGVHSRYSIPLLPFLFIWCGKLGRLFQENRLLSSGVLVLLIWSIGSSLFYFPHSLGYFNELVGGPKNGYKHLAKSDSSWGQDLLFLKKWLDTHPEAASIQIAHCGPLDPSIAGVEISLPPVAPIETRHSHVFPVEELGPRPGWFAIDVCFLLGGDPLSAADGKGDWDEPSKTAGYDLSYFLNYEPVAMAGYSIYIYHVTLEDANRVRRKLGLPPLDEDGNETTPEAQPENEETAPNLENGPTTGNL